MQNFNINKSELKFLIIIRNQSFILILNLCHKTYSLPFTLTFDDLQQKKNSQILRKCS